LDQDDLQPIVDDLAHRLRRSVAIDDPSIRLLAASRHFGDEDAVRVRSVLNRTVERELTDQLFAHGIAQWVRPGRIVMSPGTGVLPRLCAPVRCNDLLLGFLWLIDEHNTLSEDDVAAAEDAATRAGVLLYRRLLVRERARSRQEAILRELVGSDPTLRTQAVEDLRAEQVLDDAGYLQVMAVQSAMPGAPKQQAVAIEAAVEEGARAAPGNSALMVVHRSRGWLLLAPPDQPARDQTAAVAERMRARFNELAGADLAVGFGGVVTALDTVIDSYRQALLAVRAARLLPGFGGVARWGELGPYDLLLRVPADDVLNGVHLPEMQQLLRADRHGVLLETLRAYLDHAGDARGAADELCIHRATLYHRLQRIEQATGCDLRRGDDRLTLHLGLKLHLLATAYRSESEFDR
jgi:DNA-binding PucR family transcriptional regulator